MNDLPRLPFEGFPHIYTSESRGSKTEKSSGLRFAAKDGLISWSISGLIGRRKSSAPSSFSAAISTRNKAQSRKRRLGKPRKNKVAILEFGHKTQGYVRQVRKHTQRETYKKVVGTLIAATTDYYAVLSIVSTSRSLNMYG